MTSPEHRDTAASVAGSGVSDGEMVRRLGEIDWSRTPLGSRETWPNSLKLMVEVIMASGFPMSIRWGADAVMIYNDGYRPILGDKHPSAMGRPTREIWPEVIEELGPLNDSILTGERPGFFHEDYLYSVRRHAGMREDARFTISYSPIPDESAPNGIGGVLTICVETTSRVRAEQMLRNLNDTLESRIADRTMERDQIWKVSEDLLGVSNFAGYFISINPAWTALLGWTEDEIKATHIDDLRHPDDAELSWAGRAKLAQGVPRVRIENRLRHKDGSYCWISWTLTAAQGLIYVNGRNITAEREATDKLRDSERQFRLLVAGVTDYSMFMLDPTGIITSWNAGAERIKGYKADEIIGENFARFYTVEDRATGLPAKALAAAARNGTHEAEGWRVRKDGSLFWASVVLDAIQDENGSLIGFAKITRDTTERREAQETLQRAQIQLSQSQKMEALGQLTGGIAHDFNNMLMVVSGHAQSLKRRLDGPRDLRAIEAIELAASRGERLTRQLLAFSRRQSLTPTVVHLDQRLEVIRDVLASSARGDINLDIDIAPDTWPIAIDVPEFELALVNIVVNARDAMPNGGAITITAENTRLALADTADGLEGDFVALHVADTGTGIPPEILVKVFEPFFTTKQVDKGTGLGLSQVYGFTRQSGGTTVLTSKPGSGTVVTIYLRRHEGPVVAAPEPVVEDDAPRGHESILLVEDNAEVKAVATTLLEQLGYRVTQVEHAAAALKVLASGKAIDLVFSDVVMPGDMDGVALAHHVAKEYPRLPVLLTSGYPKATMAAEGFTILSKPYQLATLSRAVRETLDTRRIAAH
jgi:PAS domain S-box-containing protein